MGGKAKQAQRTKGNQRAASSSKALDLVGNVQSFVGFTTVEGGLMPVVPGFANDESLDVDANIDPNFQLVLRKMNKKDPTTKIKALKEFTELVNKSEDDIVKSILPFYPRFYIQLSTDVEPRVRENAQSAHVALVNKVGKNLATILKQVFPAWLCGQYDTHPTAASVASNCFDKAFPQKKINDVFAFCESEILDYFVNNITILTVQTVCSAKTHSPEECEAKFQRVLISSLRGYALYLEKIPKEKLELSVEKNLLLIKSDRFWSLHKNKIVQIRSAFFEVLSSLLQYGSFLLAGYEEKLVSVVFKSIDESDPALLSHIWTCIILCQMKVDNWNQYVNVNNVLLPKLSKILRSALYPCVIYPNLLPLMSKFNKSLLPDDQLYNFYVKFFENINYGLQNVHLGKSEVAAVATTYYEILQYIVMQIASDKETSEEDKLKFCSGLLDDHIIASIFWCINADGAFGKHLYHHIANLLNYWSKNSETVELYKNLMERFWSELYQVLSSSLETTTNIKSITCSHVELVKNLKNCSHNQKSKKLKIKFEDATNAAVERSENHKEIEKSDFIKQLNELVYKMCTIYIERITSTQEIEFVENLEVLIKEYQSEELFSYLTRWKNPEEVNISSLYDTFSAWLMEGELRCESIIEIILVLYKFLKPSEKIDLLNRWIRVPSVQSWIIMRALSHPLCMEPDITKLLKMKEVTDHLVDCAKNVSNGIFKENLIILQKCFFQTEDGGILIDVETCEKIVDIISEPLQDESKKSSLDSSGSFLAQIFPVICSDPQKKKLQQKMFLHMFEFSVRNEVSDDLSEDTMWEVTTAWQDALSSDDITMDEYLLENCIKILNAKMESTSIEKTKITEMDRLSEIISKLIVCSTECKSNNADKLCAIDDLTRKLLLENKKDKIFFENISQFIELMKGNLLQTNIIDTPNIDFNESLDSYIKQNVFSLDVIAKLSCNIKKLSKKEPVKIRDDDDELDNAEIEFSELNKVAADDEITEDYCDMDENLLKSWTDGICEKFLSIIYNISTLDVLLMNSKNLSNEMENWIIYMQEKLALVTRNLSDDIAEMMKEKLFQKANVNGGLWSKCLAVLLNSKFYSNNENGSILLYEDAALAINQDESITNYINILQTFAQKVPKRSLPITSNLFENYSNLLIKVSSCRSLITNHLDVNDFNDTGDRKIIGHVLNVLNEILTKQKSDLFLLYNTDVSAANPESILLVTEIVHLISDILKFFAVEVDIKRWDFIRIALSSWVLSVSKSCEKFNANKVSIFIASIFKLNSSFSKFITAEKTKSSTNMLQGVIDEWEKVFAKEVNLVLIKSFIHVIRNLDYDSKHQEYFVDCICQYVGAIDFSYTLQAKKVDSTLSLNDLIAFALENLSNKYRGICITAATIVKQLTAGLIKIDMEALVQRNSDDFMGKMDDDEDMANSQWHVLETFKETLKNYQEVIRMFIEDFTFKVNEMDDLTSISANVAFSYLLLWDCILNFCSQAPAELRSIYAKWITVHQFEEVFLVALFKLMPRDIITNPDSSTKYGHGAFSILRWAEIQESTVDNERYAAFLYAESLKTVPAIVRKWWHSSNTRQAQLVDKITTNYVSPILCQEDLATLMTKKERDGKDNMQIRVLQQSREIFATYSLEDAKMELCISLPQNYPLGAIKVDSTKHIGGKLHARQVVMQLSIYLTHQNGRLYDGIIGLWKRNLDRKFEGVEECFVCYSVIHQDNCQLPRLTCKTCKKKFHGPCLYKWFQTSNKSTCPLCRNPF